MRSNVSELVEKINAIASGGNLTGLSRIELDLLQQYLRSLYEEVENAKNRPAHSITPPVKQEVTPKAEVEQESIQPELLIAAVNEPKEENVVITKAPLKEEVTSPVKEEKPVKGALNEVIKSGGGLNEKLKTTSKEIHRSLSHKPMKDLVDLNKRIVFVNELFNGDIDAFNTAVGNIDRVEDFEGAQQYIREQLMEKYKWNETAQSTRLFLKLTRQRFGVE